MKGSAFVRAVFFAAVGCAGLPAAAAEVPAGMVTLPALPRSLRLSYEIAEGLTSCPKESVFRKDVTADIVALKDVFDDDAGASLVVSVTRGTGGYRGRAEVHDESGVLLWQRDLPPTPDCRDLVPALAVVFKVRWLWAPLPLAVPAKTSLPPGPAAPPCPTCPTCPPATACPAPPLRLPPPRPVCKIPVAGYCPFMDLTLGLSAGALITANYTSDVGPGVALGVEFQGKMWTFAVEGRVLLPSRVDVRDPIDPALPSTPAEFDRTTYTLLLVPCFRYSYFMGCAVGQFGFAFDQGPADLTASPVVRLGPRLGIEIPFADRFAARAFGEALVTPLNSYVDFPEANVEVRTPTVSAFFGAALAVSFK